jgi:YD repeat-containing protein
MNRVIAETTETKSPHSTTTTMYTYDAAGDVIAVAENPSG